MISVPGAAARRRPVPSPRRRVLFALAAVIPALALAACGDDPPPAPSKIVRAIKTYTVTEKSPGQLRKFSGVVRAKDTTELSFQVGGNVQRVAVDIGMRVVRGQFLAALDEAPYVERVRQAEAEVERARAFLADKRKQYESYLALRERDFVSRRRFEEAEAAFEAAKSQLAAAEASLRLARRDLRNTELRAPFDGVIAKREVEPFIEVAPGQTVFVLNAEGAVEVELTVPDTLITYLAPGQRVEVSTPLLGRRDDRETLEGTITHVGSEAVTANAFPVKVGVRDPERRLRPGMTAEVSILFKEDDAPAYLVPIPAIRFPDPDEESPSVFVFDPEASVVRQRPIRIRNIRDNYAEVVEGVSPGDVIAVAGVSFLYDGREVKLLEEE